MADSHAESNPNAAPMHHEIKPDFSPLQMTFAIGLGVIATVAGVVCGIVLANT